MCSLCRLELIRAAMAETIEQSSFTSAQKRVEAIAGSRSSTNEGKSGDSVSLPKPSDAFLSPVSCEGTATGPMASQSLARASDKGFTWMSATDYLEFLDALARNVRPDKKGSTPSEVPPIFARFESRCERWTDLVTTLARCSLAWRARPRRFTSIAERPLASDFDEVSTPK